MRMREVEKPKRGLAETISDGLDRFIGIFNPGMEFERRQARMATGIMATAKDTFRAARKNRSNNDWTPGTASADEELHYDLETMRLRSRDLARNDPHAAGIVLTMDVNTIGTGIKPQSRVDQEELGITPEAAIEHDRISEKIWRKWVPLADSGERMDFYEIQSMIDKQMLINGEIVGLETQIQDARRPYSLAYELIEADRLSTPTEYASDKKVRNGVRVGVRGEPVGYYILKDHPGDILFRAAKTYGEYNYYRSFNEANRRNVYHLYWMERPGQNRGYPFFAPAIDYFRQKSKYAEAELIAAQVAACFTVYVRKEAPYQALVSNTNEMDGTTRLQKISPGRIDYLRAGEDIVTANPSRPNSQFDAFTTSILRAISTSLGMPYELVAKDFSKTNYSSARAALLEARRYFEQRQQWLIRKFFQPVWENLKEEAFLRGEFGNIDFYERRSEWTKAQWIPPGHRWVDPVKEATSSAMAMENGISTGADEAAAQGKDFFENIEQLGREAAHVKAVSEKYGVDLFGRAAASAVKKQGRPEDPNNPDGDNQEDEENVEEEGGQNE